MPDRRLRIHDGDGGLPMHWAVGSLGLLVGFLLCAAGALAASYVITPDGTRDFPTIQAAIDAAADGDTLVLSDGTFTGGGNRNISFLGKAIVVRSQSGDPESCVIDCERWGRGVRFDDGETLATVLEGVTITGGWVEGGRGGGIACRNASSPVVRHCIIADNEAEDGAGIWCAESSSPSIEECWILGNDTFSNAGIPGVGGGLGVVTGSCPSITGCYIESNRSGGIGGGVFCSMASPIITDCRIMGNRPGGIYCVSSARPEIVGCLIAGNDGPRGSGIWCYEAAPVISGCTIVGNCTWKKGGGIGCTAGSTPTVERSIIWGNCALGGGGDVFVAAGSSVGFSCCAVDSSEIEGLGRIEYVGDQVFGNPRFCDPADCTRAPTAEGDYTLSSDSPCLPESSPCGELIGAFDVGCDAPAPVSTTWGRIKATFRQ